jgi:hypothetical protein
MLAQVGRLAQICLAPAAAASASAAHFGQNVPARDGTLDARSRRVPGRPERACDGRETKGEST